MFQYWYIPLILAIPLFFFWTLVHESAHAIQAIFLSGKVIDFKPYPCRIDGKWYFGYIKYEVPNLSELDRFEISFAPYGVDAMVSAILSIGLLSNISTTWVEVLLLTIMCAPLINTLNQARLALQRRNGDLVREGSKGASFLLSTVQILFFAGSLISVIFR